MPDILKRYSHYRHARDRKHRLQLRMDQQLAEGLDELTRQVFAQYANERGAYLAQRTNVYLPNRSITKTAVLRALLADACQNTQPAVDRIVRALAVHHD